MEVLTDALADALAARSGRVNRTTRTKKGGPETKAVRFARGLALGALAGAALTGLLRYRAGRDHDRRGSRPDSDS